jgi:hypothetical protein
MHVAVVMHAWLVTINAVAIPATAADRDGLAAPAASALRHVFADVLSEHLVDQRLVAHAPTARFAAELIEHARIDTDRDQLARFIPKRRASHPSHRLELLGR